MFAKGQNEVLDDYGMSLVIHTGIRLVGLSLDCLNTRIIDERCNRKFGIRPPRVRTICMPLSNMLRITYHIVINIRVKFEFIGLRHDGHVY